MAVELRVQDGPEEVAAAALEVIVGAMREAIAQRGVAHLSLAGGNTPKRTYEQLAGALGSWENVELWFNDERAVPPDDPQSNFKMVAEALGGHPTLHRIAGEGDPEAAAQAYEREMRARIEATAEAGLPVIDLHVLGIGPDGHTASLFPDYPALDETKSWVVGVSKANVEPFVPRVTLTLPTLASCREMLFEVAGSDKRAILTRTFAGENLPANRARSNGETIWLVDQAALPENFRGR